MKLKVNWTNVFITEILLFINAIFMAFWIFNEKTAILGSTINPDRWGSDVEMSWMQMGFCALIIIYLLVMMVLVIWELIYIFDREDTKSPWHNLIKKHKDEEINVNYKFNNGREKSEEEIQKQIDLKNEIKMKAKKTFKKIIWLAIVLFLAVVLFKSGRTVFTQTVNMFNTSKTYNNNYQQKLEEKEGFYDKLWKTYDTKNSIVELNREMFIEVTTIIMENRADGEGMMWKWVQENQQIPYSEFTKFYADLSDYITSQREAYFAIEKTCQHIARQHNTMLDTFPNNIYNRVFLDIEKIEFEYGFLSDSTRNVFATGNEYR